MYRYERQVVKTCPALNCSFCTTQELKSRVSQLSTYIIGGRREKYVIEIRGIKVPVSTDNKRLEQQIMKKLKLKTVPEYRILKRSIDARKKPDIFYIYTIGVELPNEAAIVKKINDNNVMLSNGAKYHFPSCGQKEMRHHPLVIGSGPAGIFCALLLAQKG